MKILFKLILGACQFILLLLLISISTFGFFPKLNFYTVNSGSMEPTIKTGSLIYVAPFKLESLKTGDIITFIQGDTQKIIVTHRIADLQKIIQKIPLPNSKTTKEKFVYEITTKGDANSQSDKALVEPNQILGLYRYQISYVGYLVNFAKTPTGFFALIVLPIIFLIILEILEIVAYLKVYYEQKAKAEYSK